MNLYQELDILTAPEPVAGKVRFLSKSEITELEQSGAIIPPGSGRSFSILPRLVVPPKWGRWSYGYRR